MQQRPVLTIPYTKFDTFLETSGWIVFIAMWVSVFYYYPLLPATIPIHFGISGEANGFGNKAMLFILPAAASFIFISMTLLNRSPHRFNYPVTITKHNALKQYTYATRLIRYLKCAIPTLFLVITKLSVSTALHHTSGLGPWFLPFMIGIIFIPILYYLIVARRQLQ
jgi:uncharacterized membrane protein